MDTSDTCEKRRIFLVSNYPSLAECRQAYEIEVASRSQREHEREMQFCNEWHIEGGPASVSGHNAINDISNALDYWAEYLSYGFCKQCHSVFLYKMAPTFFNKKKGKAKVSCDCSSDTPRYIIPSYN